MIAEVAADLRSIALSATDASGYFAALYARVTARIASSIEHGDFDDGARMDVFASTFASYYLRALRREAPRPRCWQATWDVVGDSKLLIVQHLLLAINAHVNHDLPFVTVQVAGDGELDRIRPDFEAVNDVLARSYVGVLDDLGRVARWTGTAAAYGGGAAFNFSLRAARAQAWDAAVRLHAMDEAGRQREQVELDRVVSVLAYLITQPGWPMRPVVWLARRLEEHDPRVVTATLLGSPS